MAAFGGSAPFALAFGGGPSRQRKTYDALKQAVGVGNSAPGDIHDTIMESWRFAKARGLTAMALGPKAFFQNFPDTATDFIPVYEQLLARFFPAGTSDETKRKDLTIRWTRGRSTCRTPSSSRPTC